MAFHITSSRTLTLKTRMQLYAGQRVGRFDLARILNNPDLMSSLHFEVTSLAPHCVQITHHGKKDGLVEYAVSGVIMRVSKEEGLQHFALNAGDVYKPMHDCSCRLEFVVDDDRADSEGTLPIEPAADTEPAAMEETSSEIALAAAETPADPITITDVMRTSIRGYLHSARRGGRAKAQEMMMYMCGHLNQGQKAKLADLKNQEADSWDLKHREYFGDVLEDGLLNEVNVNARGVKEQLRAQRQNDRLDMQVRMGQKRFYHPESGFIGLTDKMKQRRKETADRIAAALARITADPTAEEADPAAQIEEIDEVIDKTDDEGGSSDEEVPAGFIVDDDEPLEGEEEEEQEEEQEQEDNA